MTATLKSSILSQTTTFLQGFLTNKMTLKRVNFVMFPRNTAFPIFLVAVGLPEVVSSTMPVGSMMLRAMKMESMTCSGLMLTVYLYTDRRLVRASWYVSCGE